MKTTRIISFLENLKQEILECGDPKMYGGCGYLAAAMHIDAVVTTLMEQETKIAMLTNNIRLIKEAEEEKCERKE